MKGDVSVTSTCYNQRPEDRVIGVDSTNGPCVIQLLPAESTRDLHIEKISPDSNLIFVVPASGEKICGQDFCVIRTAADNMRMEAV